MLHRLWGGQAWGKSIIERACGAKDPGPSGENVSEERTARGRGGKKSQIVPYVAAAANPLEERKRPPANKKGRIQMVGRLPFI